MKNELQQFNNNETSKELMTTEELAKMLGVTGRTTRRTAQKLNEVLQPIAKNNQGGYLFTKEQAIAIKTEIQKHHNLQSRKIDNAIIEIGEKKEMMSTKELAQVLDVDESTIQKTVRKLAEVLPPISEGNKRGYLFTEEQATAIKKEIQKHHNLKSRQIDSVTTELEENLLLVQAQNILKKRVEEAQKKIKEQQQQIEQMQPIVEYAETSLLAKDTKTITEIAKIYNMSAKQLNKILENNQVQFKLRDQWLLYAKYQDMGYTKNREVIYTDSKGETHIKQYTLWTEKGQQFIFNLLVENRYI